MKIGMAINYASDFTETINNLGDFEAAGLDRIRLPEAYTFDAVSQLGYIAAKTSSLELATGILPLYSPYTHQPGQGWTTSRAGASSWGSARQVRR